MRSLLYNLDHDWRFDELCHRNAMDWYAPVGNDVWVWDVGREGMSPALSIQWPVRMVADKAAVNLSNAIMCAGERLANVMLVVSKSVFEDSQAVEQLIAPFREADQLVLFVRMGNQHLDLAFQGVALKLLQENAVQHVVISTARSEQGDFLALRLVVEQHICPNDDHRYPFDCSLVAEDRLLEISIEGEVEDSRLYESYRLQGAILAAWIRQWREGGAPQWQEYVQTICDMADRLHDYRGVEKDGPPKPELPKVPLFYDEALGTEIREAIKIFKDGLDIYLSKWFESINEEFAEQKETAFSQYNAVRKSLDRSLEPSVSIDDNKLTSQIRKIDFKQKEIKQTLDENQQAMRADLTFETREGHDWRGAKNRGYRRQYFDREERAVDKAVMKLEKRVGKLTDAAFFRKALLTCMILAMAPVAMMHAGHAQFPFSAATQMLLDFAWVGAIVTVSGGSMLFFSVRERNACRKAANGLSLALERLLIRHQDALKNTQAYLANILAKRHLFQLAAALKVARKEHLRCREYIDDMENILRRHGIQPTGAPGDVIHHPPRNEDPKGWWEVLARQLEITVEKAEIIQVDARRGGTLKGLLVRGLGPDHKVRIERVIGSL